MDLVESYLYVCRFLAQATDGHLDDKEWSSMVLSLARHTEGLGYTLAQWQHAMDRSRATYRAMAIEGPRPAIDRFRACVERLHDFGKDEPGLLEALLDEFWRRARVDGVLDPMEEHFLAEVERAWQRRAPALDAAA